MFTWPSQDTLELYRDLWTMGPNAIMATVNAMPLEPIREALNGACAGHPLELADAQAARFVVEALIEARRRA